MHFLDLFPSKIFEKSPHMTNLATFVQNCSNLACTPQMYTPSAPQNLSSFRVGRKIDFSKKGLPDYHGRLRLGEPQFFDNQDSTPCFLHTHTIETETHAQLHSICKP